MVRNFDLVASWLPVTSGANIMMHLQLQEATSHHFSGSCFQQSAIPRSAKAKFLQKILDNRFEQKAGSVSQVDSIR